MRHVPGSPPRGRRALAAAVAAATVLGGVGSANLVSADDARGPRPEPGVVQVIPAGCREHLALPAGPRDELVEWEHGLSLAACIQDGAVREARDLEQLEQLVAEMIDHLQLPMVIYLEALADGPSPIQIRAAFHIGLAHVALITRARTSIAAPPDLAAAPAAAARHRALHARLEPLLETSRRAAWVSFAAIHEAARRDPTLASDAVGRAMIRAARAMLVDLRDVADLRAVAQAPAR